MTTTRGTFIDRAAGEAVSDWRTTEPWVSLGLRSVLYLVGGLLIWSVLFSISGAVVAPGTVTVEGNYKTVQHRDGGIVERIVVRNGERVVEGQLLMRLDATTARAELGVNTARLIDSLIQAARFEAERDGRDVLELPQALARVQVHEQTTRSMATQRALFDARRTARRGEQAVLAQRVDQLGNDLKSLKAQLASRRKETELNAREVANITPLYEKGLVSQLRMSPLQRETARLEGEVGRLEAEMARALNGIAEAELRLAQSDKDFLQGVVDELRKTQAATSELEETRKTLKDRLARIEVKAPYSGRVHGLAVHTEGGVVAAGATLMQIIPEDERLLVEAQLNPADIDKVREGLPAGVRFSAFDARRTPRLEGTVARVSPAQSIDPQGRSFFTAQIQLPASEIARLGKTHTLVPGMPAEIFIETSSRNLLSYFLKPLTDVLGRTFRED
jgi:HlyD family secretion protein